MNNTTKPEPEFLSIPVKPDVGVIDAMEEVLYSWNTTDPYQIYTAVINQLKANLK